MLVTEKVTVKDAADAAEVPAGVWTVIGPVVAPGGTATLSVVAVTFVGTPIRPPALVTPILPLVALFGTVTLRLVPPTPIVKGAACRLFPNLTLVVPVKV